MKKRFIIIAFICFLSLILSGCADGENSTMGGKIMSPYNKSIPIYGTWRVTEFKAINKNTASPIENGTEASFSQMGAHLGKDLYASPKYKVKYININDYILKQYNVNLSDFGINYDYNSVIIQISSGDKSMYDIIKIDDNNIVMCLGNGFAYLTKISDEVDDDDYKLLNDSKIEEKKDYSNIEEKHKKVISSNLPESGALFGIKQKMPNGDISYYTIWISANNGQIMNIYKTKGLIVPRLSGFLNILYERRYNNGIYYDNIEAFQMNGKDEFVKEYDKDESEFTDNNLTKEISFVNGSYISVKNTKTTTSGNIIDSYYNLMPVDNMSYGASININDLLGKEAGDILVASAEKAVENDYGDIFKSNMVDEERFGIDRENGKWSVVAMAHTDYRDVKFNVNMVIPKPIVAYDDLYISWTSIKAAIPEAQDAYTSPNNKYAIIFTDSSIYVYMIDNNELHSKPSYRISLKGQNDVVMSEWSTGAYVEKWQSYIEASGAEKLY